MHDSTDRGDERVVRWQETDKKFQAWPRTAGPPVVMNPISRQNFIVKDLKP